MKESEGHELETGSVGKQGELRIFGMLLQRGFWVYTPMVDWAGIDCVIDVGRGNYKEIQVKTRSERPLFQIKRAPPRDNLFIICYLMSRRESAWVLPSKVFYEKGTITKRRGKEYVRLSIGREGSPSYESVRFYWDNFTLLTRGATKEIKDTVERASRRVAEPHHSQLWFEATILHLLDYKVAPVSTGQLIAELFDVFGDEFSDVDLVVLKSGRRRWEATARFAIYQGLKKKQMIESKGKNLWIITDKGRDKLKHVGDLL